MRAVIDLLAPARRVLVLAHFDPDGDALGCTLGLMHLLAAAGKEPFAYSAGPLPPEYGFLPGLDRLHSKLPEAGEVDAAVLLDCHQPARAGRAAEEFLPALADRAAVVDHHEGAVDFGAASWVEPGFSATAEMLTIMAPEAGWRMTPEAATCLFTGVLTDTGSFRYANTTPRALRQAAELVEAGAGPWQVSQEVYATRPERVRLMCRLMEGLGMEAGGRLAVAAVSLAEMAEMGVGPKDMDQMVEILRGIPGVQVSALFRELDGGAVKVSLRSRGLVDVAAVALELGGGGHRNAAGMRLAGDLDGVRRQVSGILTQRLAETG